MIKRIITFVFFIFAISNSVYAAEHQVLMLNSNDTGIMAFEPALVNVEIGDTVRFIPQDFGHNAESIEGLIPEGAKPFRGKLNSEIVVNIDKEGVYVIQCAPHTIMAMVAVIVAGKPTNLEKIKEKAEIFSNRFILNKERLTDILAKIN